MRFYDVDGGSISVEGTDIRDITRKIPAYLLRYGASGDLVKAAERSVTISHVGRPDATDEEVIAAAKASHAHSFIKRLPEGYDTVISERMAADFPRDRNSFLCITRVMLCLPPMLISG